MKLSKISLIRYLFFPEILCEKASELILMDDAANKHSKAEAELMYQLQHFYDRKRSMARNKNYNKI